MVWQFLVHATRAYEKSLHVTLHLHGFQDTIIYKAYTKFSFSK